MSTFSKVKDSLQCNLYIAGSEYSRYNFTFCHKNRSNGRIPSGTSGWATNTSNKEQRVRLVVMFADLSKPQNGWDFIPEAKQVPVKRKGTKSEIKHEESGQYQVLIIPAKSTRFEFRFACLATATSLKVKCKDLVFRAHIEDMDGNVLSDYIFFAYIDSSNQRTQDHKDTFVNKFLRSFDIQPVDCFESEEEEEEEVIDITEERVNKKRKVVDTYEVLEDAKSSTLATLKAGNSTFLPEAHDKVQLSTITDVPDNLCDKMQLYQPQLWNFKDTHLPTAPEAHDKVQSTTISDTLVNLCDERLLHQQQSWNYEHLDLLTAQKNILSSLEENSEQYQLLLWELWDNLF
jgi:hypothetical protein